MGMPAYPRVETEAKHLLDERPQLETDRWSEWLLHGRYADDPAYERVVRSVVARVADRVLQDARLSPGVTLVDVGAGEGLVAFRAIERVGPSIRVVLVDISAPMLRHSAVIAARRGIESQCKFIGCSAERLVGIADSTIDVVTARAAVAYVADKKAAFAEFHRVLKPGGRISIAEPVLQDEAFFVRALKVRLAAEPNGREDRFSMLLHRWKALQFPDTEEEQSKNPLVNYSERDLVTWARGAGFAEIHLQLCIDIVPSVVTSWEVFLGCSPHPNAPTLRTVLAEHFSPEERDFFVGNLRPLVESGKHVTTDRIVYLNAVKPAP
jgi:ubiquinone/menaquinone biosynthesis C-methylase UbiE